MKTKNFVLKVPGRKPYRFRVGRVENVAPKAVALVPPPALLYLPDGRPLVVSVATRQQAELENLSFRAQGDRLRILGYRGPLSWPPRIAGQWRPWAPGPRIATMLITPIDDGGRRP